MRDDLTQRLAKSCAISLAFCVPVAVAAEGHEMQLIPKWEYVADTVMGGVSQGSARIETVAGREAIRLRGDVSLDNNGGFVQVAFEVDVDASNTKGISFEVFGNGEVYDIRLRTTQLTRPWQSFRTEFVAPAAWTEVTLPFTAFKANKTDASFSASELRRIGYLGYGREFVADLAIRNVRLYE